MDSLTQIVLGAAVGEVVLGKKAGNRAMLWGAVAGTIPDLDVVANFLTDEITALAFHRGITHSIFFAVLAPFLFGWVVHKIYSSNYQSKKYRTIGAVFWVGTVAVFMGLLNYIPVMVSGKINGIMLIISLGIFGLFAWMIWSQYYKKDPPDMQTTYLDWVNLFFWATITHPLLDSCTAFGTQLFQPFSDYRVAFNTVSVADPLYTLPFMICLIIAAIYSRRHPWRRFVNWLGIGISSAYLLWGVYHKYKIDEAVEASLLKKEIVYERFTSSPTILNNFLWSVSIEAEDVIYFGQISINDRPFELGKLRAFPKNHHLIKKYEGTRPINILKWFSNNYFTIIRRKDGILQFNDMRFGTFGDLPGEEGDYIFRFLLKENEKGELAVEQTRENNMDVGDTFGALMQGIKGREVDTSPGLKLGPERIVE